jgi:hypothetical protein
MKRGSGKYCRRYENYSCRPPLPTCLRRRKTLVFKDLRGPRFGISRAYARPASHLIRSRPREAEAGVLRKLGLEIASKTNPSKSYCIAWGVVCLAILARTNSEGA